jgi:hypothetical protein
MLLQCNGIEELFISVSIEPLICGFKNQRELSHVTRHHSHHHLDPCFAGRYSDLVAQCELGLRSFWVSWNNPCYLVDPGPARKNLVLIQHHKQKAHAVDALRHGLCLCTQESG